MFRLHARIAEASTTAFDLSRNDAAAVLDRLAASGFDTLLLSDREALTVPLAELVGLASERAVATWLVVTPDLDGKPCFDATGPKNVAPWLHDGDAALDPRRDPRSVKPGPVSDVTGLVDAWDEAIRSTVADGISGFVCRDADRLPPSFWSALLAESRFAKPLHWVAWTAGLAPDRTGALIGAGFDGAIASVAWWDGRARWLADEYERRSDAADAAIVAIVEDPFARADQTAPTTSFPFEQRLRVAALLGDALLVPQRQWLIDGEPIGAALSAVNGWHAQRAMRDQARHLHLVGGDDAPVTALIVTPRHDVRASDTATVLLLNPHAQARSLDAAIVTSTLSGFGDYRELFAEGRSPIDPCATLQLQAGESRLFEARRLPVVQLALPNPKRSAEAGIDLPRLAIEAITPSVEHGCFPVKCTAGEAVTVEADILIDGHEMLAAALLYRAVGDRDWREVPMAPIGNDRYAARFPLHRVGRHEFTIEAWRDVFASYHHELDKKAAAGLDVSLELIEGRRLVEAAAAHARTLKRPNATRRLGALADALNANPATADRTGAPPEVDRAAMANAVAALLSSQTTADMLNVDRREFATRPAVVHTVDAERAAASFASWYELFPRSLGNAPGTPATHHGTFADVVDRLPAVKAMGFDVLYFPPIHPIGRRNRKGRNNSLTALDDDPGSPYAIGSEDGGHDALHPELGTFEDFQRMRAAALDHGLEIALDFAIQCSPDHPWLEEHPGWFAWRPDGSLRYAENPPKKYEDIVNVDFYGQGKKADAPTALWSALRDVVSSWAEQGVRIFRVDNPHTKPLPFWQWMIGEVRARYPDTIFLSEAFTRPKVMYRLAKVGFSQSYTYFTWRETKQEFIDYLTELTTTAPRDFFRPNFFVNTPDINPVFLQRSGRPGFLIRAALAATLSGLWGVYSGFELCEATPVPGKEDYLDSEKYQLRAWDWNRPGNIVAEITALNRIRRENPALRTHLNVRFQNVFDPNILYFVKATADLANVVLVAINLDPFNVHEADFELPLWQWKRPDDATVAVTDLLDGHRFTWQGKVQRMRLDPGVNPYAIWRVSL